MEDVDMEESSTFPPWVLDMAQSGRKLTVVVKRPENPVSFPNDVYKLPSTGCRGFALILNIEQFENDEDWAPRTGSDINVDYLSELFYQLNCRIFPESREERYRRRKNKLDIKEFIDEFIGECARASPPPPSVFVFIGSHGFYPNRIVTSEVCSGTQGTLDLYKDIVAKFHQDNCPALKGKPKIFLVQACQSFDEANQVDGIASCLDGPPPGSLISDALVCAAQLPGGATYRNVDKGTWFIYCFTYAMMTFACHKSLQKILKIVKLMLRQIAVTLNCRQVQVPDKTKFNLKKLYFPMEPGSSSSLTCGGNPCSLNGIQKYCQVPGEVQEWLEGESKLCVLHTLDSEITCDKLQENLEHCRWLDWEEFLRLMSSNANNTGGDAEGLVNVVKDCTIDNLELFVFSLPHRISCWKTLLVFTGEDGGGLRRLSGKVDVRHDPIEWQDLSPHSQGRIIKRLKELFGVSLSPQWQLREALRGKVLADLIMASSSKLVVGTAGCEIHKIVSVSKPSFSILDSLLPDIAMELGMAHDRIENLRDDVIWRKITLTEALNNLLEDWVARRGSQATLIKLLRVLENNGMEECGEAIRQAFHMLCQETDDVYDDDDSGSLMSVEGMPDENPKAEKFSSPAPDPNTSQFSEIGKIRCNLLRELGQGCDGTFVYWGTFEGREVAVKRILPACFPNAEREVELLKESDEHENVIRYFCTERESAFLYIALELCVASLDDWVEGKYVNDSLKAVKLLEETSEGLSHLHSLGIVHRDMKPANVLISKNGRAKISDFGISKKIQPGRNSFTYTGVRGTEGWIAPEMMLQWASASKSGNEENIKMTPAMDVFSLGCIYHFVLSGGYHPFGNDMFLRQLNIINGRRDPIRICVHPLGAQRLIELMISKDPSQRPDVSTALKHPIFWTEDKMYYYFEDVSDWLEKSSGAETGNFKIQFDRNAADALLGNWLDRISDDVKGWLSTGKFRKYDGTSLRDLLRAVRNTKHHREKMSPEIQTSLGGGELDKFVMYWLGRFPELLLHTWEAMREISKSLPKLQRYY